MSFLNKDVKKLLDNEQYENIYHHLPLIIYELYKYQFVCVNIFLNKWYEFKNHRWIPIEFVNIRTHILTKIKDILSEYLLIKSKEMETLNIVDKESEIQRCIIIQDIINKLTDTYFIKNLMQECTCKLYDDKFFGKLDNNVNLVGFDNGIFDLENGIFRDGLPNDYISLTVKYDYKEYKEDNQEINTFLEKLFQDNKTREEFVLTFIASMKDEQKKIMIMIKPPTYEKKIMGLKY